MRRVDYLLYTALLLGAFGSLAGGVLLLSPHVIFAGIALSTAAAVLLKFGDWLLPALLASGGVHPVYRAVELLDDAVLFQEDSEWVAAGFVLMNIQMSPLEEGEKQQLVYLSKLSHFYTHLPEETVIYMYLKPVDINSYRSRLETRYQLALQDLQAAESENKTAAARRLKLKVQELERELQAIESDRPIDVDFAAKVAARAASRETALQLMRERRRNLESAIRGVMNVSTRSARGQELIDVMRILLTLPKSELLQ